MRIRSKKCTNFAFSLVELLTIAAVVAILAIFAVYNLSTYKLDLKAQALWQAAEGAKLAVESKYLKENVSLSSIDVNSGTASYTTPTDSFVKCITIQDGKVSVVGLSSEFSNQLIWVSWVPTVSSGAITWACTYSSAAADYFSGSAINCSVGTASYSADTACN